MTNSLALEDYVFQQTENALRIADVMPEDFSWNIDVPSGLLMFTSATGQEVARLPIQLVGTQSDATQTWLWAWANEASGLPDAVTVAARKLRDTAAQSGSPNTAMFTNAGEVPLTSEEFGREMGMICAGVVGGFGVYRCPYAGGALWTVIESFPQAQALPPDAMRTMKTITMAISNYDVDHKAAARAYLGEPDASGTYQPSGVRLEYDAQGRISNITSTLTQANVPPAADKMTGDSESPFDKIKRLFGGGG